MSDTAKIDMTTHVIGINRRLDACPVADSSGHDSAIDGLTFGVALMTENAPHLGERHPDGDEVVDILETSRIIYLTPGANNEIRPTT